VYFFFRCARPQLASLPASHGLFLDLPFFSNPQSVARLLLPPIFFAPFAFRTTQLKSWFEEMPFKTRLSCFFFDYTLWIFFIYSSAGKFPSRLLTSIAGPPPPLIPLYNPPLPPRDNELPTDDPPPHQTLPGSLFRTPTPPDPAHPAIPSVAVYGMLEPTLVSLVNPCSSVERRMEFLPIPPNFLLRHCRNPPPPFFHPRIALECARKSCFTITTIFRVTRSPQDVTSPLSLLRLPHSPIFPPVPGG